MKKEDLKSGNVVELRDGNKFIVIVKFDDIEFDLVSVKGNLLGKLSGLNENLEGFGNHNFDIVKVYADYTLTDLLWKCVEIRLTEDEKAILRNLPKECKYIARDREGNLYVHLLSPRKEWGQWLSKGSIESLVVYNHLFNFIKWEDDKPYLISDLLEEE